MIVSGLNPSEVYVCIDPVDFRKGIFGLATLVESEFDLNPFSGGLFVFGNRRRDQVKILYWDRNGFCLWQKRLEQDRYHWLSSDDHAMEVISRQQLDWLLDGLDLRRVTGHKERNFSSVC